jgi:hypothetical protein
MNKTTFITILITLMLAANAMSVLAQSPSHEIDHVETTENSRIIYYKDGTKEAFFGIYEDLGVSSPAQPSLPLGLIGIILGIINAVFGFPQFIKNLIGLLETWQWRRKYGKSRNPLSEARHFHLTKFFRSSFL